MTPAASTSLHGADRVRSIDATYAGTWELPAIGSVPAPTAVLVRPDGYVSWVGHGTQLGLADALTTWFWTACCGLAHRFPILLSQRGWDFDFRSSVGTFEVLLILQNPRLEPHSNRKALAIGPLPVHNGGKNQPVPEVCMRLASLAFLSIALAATAAAQETNFSVGPQYLMISGSPSFARPIATPSLSFDTGLSPIPNLPQIGPAVENQSYVVNPEASQGPISSRSITATP